MKFSSIYKYLKRNSKYFETYTVYWEWCYKHLIKMSIFRVVTKKLKSILSENSVL